MEIQEYTKHYLTDINFLKEVDKIQNDFINLPSIATKDEAAKEIIVDRQRCARFLTNCLETIGEQDIILEKQAVKIQNITGERNLLKGKLDKEGIIYKDELKKFRENNTTLMTCTESNTLKRGYQVLMKKARRNQKI